MEKTSFDMPAEKHSYTDSLCDRLNNQMAAAVLKATLPALLSVLVLIFCMVSLDGEGHELRHIPTGVVAASLLLVMGLQYTGRIALAAFAYVAAICIGILLGMLLNGGVSSLAFRALMPLLAMVGLLFGSRTAVTFLSVSAIASGIFVWLDAHGLLRQLPEPTPMTIWAVSTGYLLMTFVVTAIPGRILRQALSESEANRLEAERLAFVLADRESMLRESEKRFRLLAENSTDMISRHDLLGVYLYASPSCRTLMGFAPDEMVGHSAFEFIHPDDLEKVEASRKKLTQNLAMEVVCFRVCRKDGSYIWLESANRLIMDEAGRPVEIQVSSRDITRRRAEEDAFREIKELYETLTEISPVGVWQITPDRRTLYANPAVRSLLELDSDESFTGKTIDSFFTAEGLELMKKHHQKRQQGARSSYELELVGSRGGKRTVVVSGSPLFSGDGKLTSLIAWLTDVTDRKQMEQELRENEKRFRSVLESLEKVAVQCYEPDGTITFWNRGSELIYGLSAQNALGHNILDLIHGPETREDERRLMDEALLNGDLPPAAEINLVNQNGQKLTIFASRILAPRSGKAPEFFCFDVDITERKRSEEILEKSKKSYEAIYNASTDCIFIHDAKTGAIVDVNQSTIDVFGYTKAEIKTLNVGDFSVNEPPYTQKEAMAFILKSVTEGPQFFVWLSKRKSGELIWTENSLQYLELAGEQRVLVVARDITERKKAEEALRKSEDFRRAVFESSRIPVVVMDRLTQRFLDCNPAAVTSYGFKSRLEVIGKMPADVSASIQYGGEPSAELASRYIEQALKQGSIVFEWRHRRPDGTEWDAEVHLLSFEAGGATMLQFSLVDITERKRSQEEKDSLQKQLSQAQKMESVGRLAGGVAHDFNNMLGVIMGYAELAQFKIGPDSPLCADLKEISRAAQRSADLTRQLLAFARKQTITPRVLDLNGTVDGMLKMLRRLVGENIEIAWQPGSGIGTVLIDPSQVDQILANLCVNARDAIVDTGRITIETGCATLDQDYCSRHSELIPGEYVLLSLSDDGCGMSPEIQAKIFEPFFTTKEAGKGTGLGLATVYGIVKQNNGSINVFSDQGHGTTFRIYLPCHTGKANSRPEEVDVPVQTAVGETILLVEDEPFILEMTTQILEMLGYPVVTARTPEEAIRLTLEYKGQIDLLLTDVIMPAMNGRDLAIRIRAIYPGIRCLFMSGYTADIISRHGVLDKGVHFIQKPFLMKDLATRIRETLKD